LVIVDNILDGVKKYGDERCITKQIIGGTD